MSADNSGSVADQTFVDCGLPNIASLASSSIEQGVSKQLGPYKILREIGRGAMGTVYEAQHAQLERRVALKLLPPELATSPKRLRRFRREMAAVGRLDHPNIVLATDAGEIDGLCYIAMQFVDGPDLEQVLEEIGRFEPADACEIVRQAALGLEHIGNRELVHRDIKPSNILLTRSGQAKIVDLGVAMLRNAEQLDTSVTVAGSMMGTPDYIAPEQIAACGDVDIRADIYSLGCTLYCLLSGQSPFNGPGYTTLTAKLLAHASEAPPSLSIAHAEIPKAIVDLVEKMMSKQADDRPATPSEVAKLISPFCAGADLIPLATGQRKGRPRKPLDLQTAADSESSSKIKSDVQPKTTRSARQPQSPTAGFGFKKLLCVGAVTTAIAGVLWFSLASPIVSGDQAPATADAEPNPPVIQTQAMLASINESIAKSIEVNAMSANQLATTLHEMQSQFAKRQSENDLGSIVIREPQSPVDHYYNACLYSKTGDYPNAKKSYMKYFENELPVIDPHLKFAALIKYREGVQGARAVYDAIPGNREFVGRKLALATLEPDGNIVNVLEELNARHPDCAPVVYQLSQCFDADSNRRTTLSQARRHRALLLEFVSLHQQGKLVPHFLDQNIPADQLEQTRKTLKTLPESASDSDRVPVSVMSFNEMSGHWRIGLQFDELAQEIFWTTGEDGEFESTGPAPGATLNNARPDVARPNPYFSIANRFIKAADDNFKIFVKYTNANGQMQGPYKLDFDPRTAAGTSKRNRFERLSPSWARFEDNRLHFRLFHLRMNDLVEAVHYGLNNGTPTLKMPIPEQPFSARNADDFYVPIDTEDTYVSLQVTFVDGTKSKVVKIYRE